MSEEISKKRKELVLFIFSAVVFGLVLSFLSLSLPYLIPEWVSPSAMFIASLFALVLLGLISFKLIVPPLQIKEVVDFCLIQNMEQKSIFTPIKPYYNFWFDAGIAFGDLVREKPEYEELLEKPFELRNEVLRDLVIYLLLCWLSQLPASTIIFDFRRPPAPPKLYSDENEKMRNIHVSYFANNLKNVFLEIPSLRESVQVIRLPRNMDINVEKDKITLWNRYVKITLTFAFYRWFRGIDLRLKRLFSLTDEEINVLGTLFGGIQFEAQFKPLAMVMPTADKYYSFAKDMLENLRRNYSWSACLDDLKEFIFWDHTLKN
jgi:hypothetical protein